MKDLEKLFTTRDLAQRYRCEPRAVARMASLGRWPSRMVLGEYRFDAEMVAWIDAQHERWPQNEAAPAEQPKPQPAKQTRQRRSPQPPPPAQPGNVRQFHARERPNRTRRSA